MPIRTIQQLPNQIYALFIHAKKSMYKSSSKFWDTIDRWEDQTDEFSGNRQSEMDEAWAKLNHKIKLNKR